LTSALSGIVKEIDHQAFRTMILPMLYEPSLRQLALATRTSFSIPLRDDDGILFAWYVSPRTKEGPQRLFVDVCTDNTNLDQDLFWAPRTGVIPLMHGRRRIASCTFATNLKQRFRDHVPGISVVMKEFLNSQQLVKILKDALLLNMHPAIYEAYGMTIVEAGACLWRTHTFELEGHWSRTAPECSKGSLHPHRNGR
jgi:hypothetical protein